jgi:hypothetical protein
VQFLGHREQRFGIGVLRIYGKDGTRSFQDSLPIAGLCRDISLV